MLAVSFTVLLLGRVVPVVVTLGRNDCGCRSRRLAGWRIVMSGRHSRDESRGASRDLDAQDSVPGDVFLARTATRPLTRHDRTPLEDLATPHAPGLCPLQGAGQALDAKRALRAEGLGQFQLTRSVGEPQVRVERAAG